MRILEVIHSLDPVGGGPAEGVKQLSSVLQAMGHCVEVATLDVPGTPHLSTFPLTVHALGVAGRGHYGYSPRFRPWLAAHGPHFDAVVVNGIWQYHSRATSLEMSRLCRPYCVFPHGMLDPWFSRAYPLKHFKKSVYWMAVENVVLGNAAAVFTAEEERLLARHSFRPYRVKERVLGYGTAPPQGDPEQQAELFFSRFPELRSKRILLFLSRIHEKKGCDLLLRSFAEVCGGVKDITLLMVGPDQDGLRGSLEELALSLGIQDRILWTGMLSGDLKWGAFHSCEAFILPSHQENFGIVVAEALACSKPVLISNKVNIWREVLESGAGIVDDDTVEGTTRTLRGWLSKDLEQRLIMGGRALQCFQKNFDINEVALRYLSILDQLANRAPDADSTTSSKSH